MTKHHLFLAAASLLVLAGCKDKQSPQETATHFKAAQDLYAQKDYTHALVEIQNAIKGDPKSGDAHFLAAQIQEGLANPKGAFEEYARAAMPEAGNIKAQLKVAQILIEANQLDAALGRINGTLGSRPNDPDALALRAWAEQRKGDRDKARADAQLSLLRSPGQPIATSVMAADALADKNSDKALVSLAIGLKAHPTDVPLIRLKAAALLMQDKKDEAVALYQDLLKADPKSVGIRSTLAELDVATGQVDAGEQLLRDGVAALPDSREMRAALIVFMAKHRGDQAADKAMQEAIAATPKDSSFDLMRAEALLRAKKPDEAAQALQSAIARVPEGPARSAVRLALARLDLGMNDPVAARKLLDDAVTAKADDDDALLLRAELMVKSDDAAHAIPDLLAVAARRPRSASALAILAQAYTQQGDTDKAIDAWKKVVYFDPANLQPVTALANLYLKQSKPDLARQALADYVNKNPEGFEGRMALVRLAAQQKDWTAAQAAIDQMRRVPRSERVMALLNAELSEAKGTPVPAAAAYMKMIDASGSKPLDREALAGYARSSVAGKQTDQAITFVSALTEKLTGEDAAVADLVLSALYRNAGQDDKANDATALAIKAAPKLPAAYLEAAAALRKTPDRAVAVLNDGLAAGAPGEPLLMAKASLQEQADNKDPAIATYQDVLKLNPQSVVAANNYASLVADMKPNDKALLSEARKPLQRVAVSNNPALLDTLAWIDYRLGDFPSAKALLVRAKADTSDNPQLRFHYGAVLMAMGDKDAGRSVVKAALSQPFPGRQEAERMLTE
ncbi:tetratricopeptide repeat protein [Lichenifustis flavocetrariae]|uniref:Tetratricopeptide repeat protein n=1 Tax=Lichenifustis flavocetrariae TaxID=2949735 RepID=A0AA41YXN7_9HYPH|nr:tetratricopeptide repeat protein [Lichenifustis flavocetrariae]MCW6506745.1 tetratricopeptide repeat protein [Lichenifustis flavocetrariae]